MTKLFLALIILAGVSGNAFANKTCPERNTAAGCTNDPDGNCEWKDGQCKRKAS